MILKNFEIRKIIKFALRQNKRRNRKISVGRNCISFTEYKTFFLKYTRMAELVDALVSGTSVRKDVQVRVLFRVQDCEELGVKN